ncbi:MAG TPA: phosphodiester glycosidase family protein, partial [Spirochaetia bacterium]|nr:phosphodiester glycosidase family protein [Spirochaetia bacterium]
MRRAEASPEPATGGVRSLDEVRAVEVDGGRILFHSSAIGPLEALRPIQGSSGPAEMRELERLFRASILPSRPEIGALVLLRHAGPSPFPASAGEAEIYDPARRAAYWLARLHAEGELRIEEGALRFRRKEYTDYAEGLASRGLLRVIERGEGQTRFLSAYPGLGLLSAASAGRLALNSHFFQMELSDCETAWDLLGTPFGLLSLRGEILLPPLFDREALVIRADGSASVEPRRLRDQAVAIGPDVFRHGENCEFISRPACPRTPRGACVDLVVVGRELVGAVAGGGADVPEGGFVLRAPRGYRPSSLELRYPDESGDRFAIQVGPAMISSGTCARGFTSPMYAKSGVPFPPTVYPLDWEGGRAARIGLGTRRGEALVIWAAGPDRPCDELPTGSVGASLAEFTELCRDLGLDEAVNLDGGGSAQVCVDGRRHLAR